MKLLVHGCRGSIPISTPQSNIYGGNTSCYELIFNEYQLIFDTGTGFRHVSIDESKKTIIFYSHWHHDHIQGLAFNSGLYNTKKDIFVSSALNNKNESKNIIHQYFSGFYFPLELIKIVTSKKPLLLKFLLSFIDCESSSTLTLPSKYNLPLGALS